MGGIGFSYRKYIAVIALQIVLVMTVLDVTVVNVALPVLAEEFGISNSSAVWIVTIYQLVITMLLLPVSSVFALVAVELNAVRICLYLSVAFALTAGVFSYTRTLGHKKELHM